MVSKNIVCIILASFFIFLQTATNIKAGVATVDDIVDGFTPPKNTTVIHYLNTGEKPYTKIANAVSELWVGDHHRFTVMANKRENVKILWYSSNPEIASIKKTTGELTALSAGETTVTMWDSTNKKKHKITLTVKPVPILPEIPREWYTVEEKPDWGWVLEDGIQLILKSEYRYLYEQCSMLRIPEYVDGKKVVSLSADDVSEYGLNSRASFHFFGFTQLKILQCPESIEYLINESLLDEIVYSEGIHWIEHPNNYKRFHIPESVDLILSEVFRGSKLEEVRIPASVKFICRDDSMADGWGVCHGENVRFAVDGNNTNYYSISDVLFAYPYDKKEGSDRYIWIEPYYIMEAGNQALLAYPKTRTGKVYYVPDGIERIEAQAFYGAQNLEKIILPDSVTEIGEMAFYNIRNNVEITIPASVTKFEDSGEGGPFGIFESDDEQIKRLTIITPKGSAAEAYAIDKGIAYRNE